MVMEIEDVIERNRREEAKNNKNRLRGKRTQDAQIAIAMRLFLPRDL